MWDLRGSGSSYRVVVGAGGVVVIGAAGVNVVVTGVVVADVAAAAAAWISSCICWTVALTLANNWNLQWKYYEIQWLMNWQKPFSIPKFMDNPDPARGGRFYCTTVPVLKSHWQPVSSSSMPGIGTSLSTRLFWKFRIKPLVQVRYYEKRSILNTAKILVP